MLIGSCKSKPGKISRGQLEVANFKNKKLKIPVLIAEGKKPGKTVFISGGMHGNELNGIELVHRFIHYFEKNNLVSKLSGTIIFLPLLNERGFKKLDRHVLPTREDLNRSFPGKRKGTLAEQMAYSISQNVIKYCDFGIDCHDSGTKDVLLPHSRVHVSESGICKDGCTYDMGGVFGTDLVMVREGKKGMMAISSNSKFKIPILTVEIGGALVLWGDFLSEGIRGIKNLLIYNNMLSGKIVLPDKQLFIPDEGRHFIKAPCEGLLDLRVSLGDIVEVGQKLAVVHDPLISKEIVLVADFSGVVLSAQMMGKLLSNRSVLSILHFDTCPINKRKPLKGFVIKNKSSQKIKLRKSKLFSKALSIK